MTADALASLFAAARQAERADAPPSLSEMLVTQASPLRARFPADTSTTYPVTRVGPAVSVGDRILVIHSGAAAHYCLGAVS